MRLFVVIIIIFFGVIKGIQSPVAAGMFYSWVTLFRPQDFLYSGSTIPYLVPISATILFFATIFFRVKSKIKFEWNIGARFLACILLVCIVSASLSPSKLVVWDKVLEISKIIIPCLIISISVSKERHFRMLILAFAFSIGTWAIQGAIHGLMIGKPQSLMSIGGQMSDRNDFAVGILMTLPLWYYLGLNAKSKLVKSGFLFSSALIAVSILVTNSRAAILGLVLLSFFIFVWQTRNRLRNILLLILVGGIVINFIPDYTFERISTIEWGLVQADGSASERLVLMEAGIDGALDNPWFGVGPGAWAVRASQYIPPENANSRAYEPHSIWIKVPAEIGFVGLAVYLFMFFMLMYNLRKVYKLSSSRNDYVWVNYSIMLQMVLLAYCLAGTFFNQIYYEYLFLMVAVVGSYLQLSKMRFEGVENSDNGLSSVKKSSTMQKA